MNTNTGSGLADAAGAAARPAGPGWRVAGAAAAGTALVVSWILVTALVAAAVPCQAEGLGCLGQAITAAGALAVAAALAAWPLMYLLRIRPAWPAALLGPILMGGLGWLAVVGLDAGWGLVPLVPPVSYAVAAFVTGPGVRWPWRVALVLLLVSSYPLAPRVDAWRHDRSLERWYAGAGVPLMAPDLPGYVIVDPQPNAVTHEFRYKLRRTSVRDASTGEWVPSDIGVLVARVPTRFNPLERCPHTGDGRPIRPCDRIAADTWRVVRRDNGYRKITYLVWRDSALVTLTGHGWKGTPEDAMRRAATTMRARPPSYFTRGPERQALQLLSEGRPFGLPMP